MRDYSKWKKQWEKDQEHRRLCFARFCWVNRYKLTPSKKSTWEQRFEEAYKAEQSIHALLKQCNLRTLGYTDCGRELFKCTIQEAADAITKVQSENDRPSVALGA